MLHITTALWARNRHSRFAVQQQPQLVPMALSDGRVTYVTPEQYSQLAAVGMSALARAQSAPPPQQHYTPPPLPRSAFSEERAGSIAQRLSFGTIDEQKAAVMDLARPAGRAVSESQRG
jgi:hypothetical protein